MSISECNSGCESGWTMYLDNSENYYRIENVGLNDQEDEEDLSMVSDASSRPRHEDEHNGYFSLPTNKNKNKNKNKFVGVNVKEHRGKINQTSSSYLDDTASSPVFNFSKKNVLVMSNDQASQPSLSATHLKGQSALQKHFGVSNPGSGASRKSGGLKKGRKQ